MFSECHSARSPSKRSSTGKTFTFGVVMHDGILPTETDLPHRVKPTLFPLTDYDFQLCGSQALYPGCEAALSPSQTFPHSPHILSPATPFPACVQPARSSLARGPLKVQTTELPNCPSDIPSNSPCGGSVPSLSSSSESPLTSVSSQSAEMFILPDLYDPHRDSDDSESPSPPDATWQISPSELPGLPELSLGSSLASSLGLSLSCENLSSGQTSFPSSPVTPADTYGSFNDFLPVNPADRPRLLRASSAPATQSKTPATKRGLRGSDPFASHGVMPRIDFATTLADIGQAGLGECSRLSLPTYPSILHGMSTITSAPMAASPAMQHAPSSRIPRAKTGFAPTQLAIASQTDMPLAMSSPSYNTSTSQSMLLHTSQPAVDPAAPSMAPPAPQPVVVSAPQPPAVSTPSSVRPSHSQSALGAVIFPGATPSATAAPAPAPGAPVKKGIRNLLRKPRLGHSSDPATPVSEGMPSDDSSTISSDPSRMSMVSATTTTSGTSMMMSMMEGDSGTPIPMPPAMSEGESVYMMAMGMGAAPLSRTSTRSSASTSASTATKVNFLRRIRTQLSRNRHSHSTLADVMENANCPTCQNTGFKNGNPQTPCDDCWDENTKPWRAFFYRLLAKKLPQPLKADASPEAMMAAVAAYVEQAGGESAMMSDAGMAALVQEAMEMAAAEEGATMATDAQPVAMQHPAMTPMMEHETELAAMAHPYGAALMVAETQQALAPAMAMAQHERDALVSPTPTMAMAPAASTPVTPQDLMAMAQQLAQIALVMSQQPPSRPPSTALPPAGTQPAMMAPVMAMDQAQAMLTAQPAPAMDMEHLYFAMAPCGATAPETTAMASHSAMAITGESARPLPMPMAPEHPPMAAPAVVMADEQPGAIRLVTDLPPAPVNASAPSPLTPKDTESPIEISAPPPLWQPMQRRVRRPHAHSAQIRSLTQAPSTPPPPPPVHS